MVKWSHLEHTLSTADLEVESLNQHRHGDDDKETT